MDQVTAVNERNYFYSGRQNALIQLFNLRVDSRECLVGIRAFPHGYPRRNYIVVIDDLSVFAMNRSGELAEPDLWALRDVGDIFYAQRCAALGRNDGVFDIANVLDLSNFTNVDLLEAGFNKAATRIRVVVRELLLHLGEV